MAEISALRDEAANPTTDPNRLAVLAQQEPALGAVVAANPAAYEALLDWLAQHGDDAAKHAVAVRRGATPVLPVNPFAIPVVAANPFAAATPREPRKRMSKGAKRGLVFGIVGTLVLALVAAAGITYVAVFGWPIIPAVTTADIRTEPRDAWGMVNPAAAAADFDDDLDAFVSVVTVGQDRALVTSSTDDDDSNLLSLLDTGSGSVLWTVDWEQNYGFNLLSELGATPVVVQTNRDSEQVVLSIDAANGEIISENDDPDVQGANTSAALDGLGLGGDVLLRTEDGISRYSPSDLNDEKWSVDFGSEDYTLVRDRLIIGDEAYDLDTGEKTKWSASEELTVLSSGHMLLGFGGDFNDHTYYRLDDRGFVYWKESADDSELVYFDSDVMVLANRESGELTAIDMFSGDKRWSEEFPAGEAAGSSSGAGILFWAIGEGDTTAIDLTTGDELYDFSRQADDRLVAMGETVYYLAEDNDLTGYDLRTGDELWSFDNPDDYLFIVSGGNIVGVQNDSAEDSEDHAAVIGIRP